MLTDNKNKRGQVTIFIIVAIVILIIAAIIIVVLQASKEKPAESIDTLPIRNYIQKCIDDTALTGVFTAGKQGGKIVPSENFMLLDSNLVGIGLNKGIVTLPVKEEVRQELELYMDAALKDCISRFDQNKSNFQIQLNEIKTTATINEDNVIFKVSKPAILLKDGAVQTLDDVEMKYNVRLGHAISISTGIISEIQKDGDWIDVSKLGTYDVKVGLTPIDNTTIIYTISEDTKYGDRFVFNFGVVYKVNNAPIVNLPETLPAVKGIPFLYKVNATDIDGDILKFDDNDGMFDIDQNGTIKFVPQFKGEYPVTIIVTDARGAETTKIVRFIIS